MLKKICLTLLVLTHLSFAAEWIQGQWNGQPWQREELIKKAQQGDPDAMAEWAYCSYFTANNIPNNPAKITEYARRAAENDSILGKSMHAYCLMLGTNGTLKPQQGLSILEELSTTKHPFVDFCIAQSYTIKKVRPRDTKKTLEMLEQLTKKNVVQAPPVLAFFIKRRDPDRAMELLKQSFEKHNNSTATSLQFLNLTNVENRYGKAYADKVTENMLKIASLGSKAAIMRLAEVASRDEDSGNVIQLIKPRALSGHTSSIEALLSILEKKPIDISPATPFELAKTAYGQGSTNEYVLVAYHHGLINALQHNNNYDELAPLIEEACRKGTNFGQCRMHNHLGEFFMLSYTNYKGPVEHFDRAESNFIYHFYHASDYCSYMLAYYYLDNVRLERRDLAKGIAAAHVALKANKGQHQIDCLSRQRNLALLEATDAEKSEAERLIQIGFPNDKDSRRRAFDHLKEIGDMPAHIKF